MVTDIQREEILNLLCDIYEQREDEIEELPLAYAELLLIAKKVGVSVEEVASVFLPLLNEVLEGN